MDGIFKVPAMIVWIVGIIWGLIVCIGIVSAKLGFLAVLAGLIVLPALVYLAPWWAAFADGNWFPVMLIYGASITAWVLIDTGSVIDYE